jgi:hypothetical protein
VEDHAVEPIRIEIPVLLKMGGAGREIVDRDHARERTRRLAHFADGIRP